MKTTTNTSMDQKIALRAMYHGFVDLIASFQNTMAYEALYDEDDEYEQKILEEKVNMLLQKARIDLNLQTYQNLKELMNEVVNTSLEDITSEEDEDQEMVDQMTDEFYDRLASTMKMYMYSNKLFSIWLAVLTANHELKMVTNYMKSSEN